LHRQNALPGSDQELRTRQILENVVSATRTHINNLSEIGLLKEHEPRGGRSYIFHERTEERLYDEDLKEIVDEEIERLLEHIMDDAEVRRFVAALLDIETKHLDTDEVVKAIRDRFFDIEDALERMELFDEVAQEIEAQDVDTEEYEYAPIGWRRSSNRYTLSRQAVNLYEEGR